MRNLLVTVACVAILPLSARGHIDHGVGGERIHFGPIPSVSKPSRGVDKVLAFSTPPSIQAHNQDPDFTKGLTVAAWVHLTDTTSANPVITQLEWSPGSGSFALFASGGPGRGFQLRFSDGSHAVVGGYGVPANRWVHLVATYDGTKANVFLDGESVVAEILTPRTVAKSLDPVLIGASDPASGVPFQGMIDDVRIWERSLTGDEARRLRINGTRLRGVSRSWSFEPGDQPESSETGQISYISDPAGERGVVAQFAYAPYLAIDPEKAQRITTQLTISAWVHNRGVRRQGGSVVGSWGADVKDRSFVLYSLGGDGFGFRAFWEDGTQNNLTVIETPSGEWFHYAATYDGREMRLYVNGIPSGRTIAVDKTFTRPEKGVWVGGVGSVGIGGFQGFLDDVGVWSRAFTATEITDVMLAGTELSDDALIFWSDFDRPILDSQVHQVSATLVSPSVNEAAAAGKVDVLEGELLKHTQGDESVTQAFWWAAMHNRLDAAEFLLSEGADINAKLGLGGHTALHAAVRDRLVETIQFLIDNGADANLKDTTFDGSAWGWAGRFGYHVLRSYLLDSASLSDLYAAVEHDTPGHIERILEERAGWNLGKALRQAARLGRPEILTILLDRGADPELLDGEGRTAHDLAVLNSRYESVDVLRARTGKDVSGSNSYFEKIAALDSAIASKDPDVVRSILKDDSDLARSNPQGERTWLQRAADVQSVEVARALLERGASTGRVQNGHTALSWAVTVGALSVAREVLKGGSELDLFTAAGLGDVENVTGYFDGADLRENASRTGSTRIDQNRDELPKPPVLAADQISDALYIAARNGHLEVVQFLLGKGAEPNFRAARGGTPLYWAVREGHLPVVWALLDEGGDAGVPDRYGQNATQIAIRSKRQDLKKALGLE